MTLKRAIAATVSSVYIHARLAEERLRSGVAWWPLAPGFVANPYPVYRKLRERDPVHYSILTDQVVVTRYEDVDRILRDHRDFSNDLHKARSSRGSLATRKKLKPSMLVRDPRTTHVCEGSSIGRSRLSRSRRWRTTFGLPLTLFSTKSTATTNST